MCLLPCWPFTDLYLEELPKKKKKDEGVVVWDPVAKTYVKLTGVVPFYALGEGFTMTQQEQNFQPQVRDTSAGPNIHTYIPREDGAVIIGGVTFLPQTGVPTAATIPVTATGTPLPTRNPVSVTPYFMSTGGPTIPAFIPPPVQVFNQQSMAYPLSAYSYGNPYPYPYGPPQPSLQAGYHIQQPALGTIGYTTNETLMANMATAQVLEMNKKQEMKPADDDPMRMYWCRELDGTWTQRNRLTIDSGDIGDCRWYTHEGAFYTVRLPS